MAVLFIFKSKFRVRHLSLVLSAVFVFLLIYEIFGQTGIQPGMLKPTSDNPKFLSMGFLNRFLAFYPTDMPKRTARKSKEAVTIAPVVSEAWEKLISDTYNNVATSVITGSEEAVS